MEVLEWDVEEVPIEVRRREMLEPFSRHNGLKALLPRSQIPKLPTLAPAYLCWITILDFVGPYKNWGPMRKTYRNALYGTWDNKDRGILATFAFVNGCPFVVMQQFGRLRGIGEPRLRRFVDLYFYFSDPQDGGSRRRRYYSFDVNHQDFYFLNGERKLTHRAVDDEV